MDLETSGRRFRPWFLLCVLPLLVCCLTPGSANALPQGSWNPGFNLSQGPGSGSKALIAEDGTTTIVWMTGSSVMSSTRPPGQATFDTATLVDSNVGYASLDAALSPDGTVTVAWMDDDGSVSTVARAPGGTFGQVEQVAPSDPERDDYGYESGLRVASSNLATAVVWNRMNGTVSFIQASVRTGHGTFGRPVNLSPTADVPGRRATGPELAVGPDGTATVVWTQQEPGLRYVLAATAKPGAGFGAPLMLSEGGRVPHIDVSHTGSTLVAWSKTVRGRPKIQIASRPARGRFTLPRSFASRESGSSGGNEYLVRGVDFTGDGTAVIATNQLGEVSSPQVMIRPSGGSFARPEAIPGSEGFRLVAMSVGNDGTINLISNSNAEVEAAVMVSTRLPGGVFGDPVLLEEYSSGASSIATGPGGIATATWSVGGLGKFDYPEVKTASTSPDDTYCERATLRLGRNRINRRTGNGFLNLATGTQGSLTLFGTRQVKGGRALVASKGRSRLKVKARGRAARSLRMNGRVRVKVTVKFRPGFGCAVKSRTRTVKLVRRMR